MIIIEVMGGLGNQLQQYALYEKMKSLGKEAKLDISWFTQAGRQSQVLAKRKLELDYFAGMQYDKCTPQEKEELLGSGGLWQKARKKLMPSYNRHFMENGMYHPEIFEKKNAYLTGFWACEKYYADVLPSIREKLNFPDSKNAEVRRKNEELLKEIQEFRKQGGHVVSIHIRRGDYLDKENASMFGGICTDAYYQAAMQKMKKEYDKVRFLMFSDDIPYVREHYQGEEFLVADWNTGEDSIQDMRLMSACDGNICANSTFSFWGARFNKNEHKKMIRPAKHKNSQVIIPEVMKDLWSGWILIDENGKEVG